MGSAALVAVLRKSGDPVEPQPPVDNPKKFIQRKGFWKIDGTNHVKLLWINIARRHEHHQIVRTELVIELVIVHQDIKAG
jgi:hypothetical protein